MEKDIIAKMKKAFEDNFGQKLQPRYERDCECLPEDMSESRTSWDEMREYADEMSLFICEIRSILYTPTHQEGDSDHS